MRRERPRFCGAFVWLHGFSKSLLAQSGERALRLRVEVKQSLARDGGIVTTFPKLPEFQQVTLKVLRWEERDKRLVIKDAEIVP